MDIVEKLSNIDATVKLWVKWGNKLKIGAKISKCGMEMSSLELYFSVDNSILMKCLLSENS